MNKYLKKIKENTFAYIKDPFLLKKWDQPNYYRAHHTDNQLSQRMIKNKRGRYHYHGTSSIFTEDMFSGIMPFMIYGGTREKYSAKIEPASKEKKSLIAQGLSDRSYRTELEEGLCEFVRETAQALFRDGVAFYEIIYKKDSSGKTESFSFEPIQPFNLFKVFGNYYQFILWDEAKASNTRVRVIKIPKDKVFRIDFPKQLGNKRKVNKMLKRLWWLGKDIFPEFEMEAMREERSVGFNSKAYSDSNYLEIATITKDFGWNQRQLSTDHITEYYALLRLLREKKAEAVVRDVIFSKLNEVLNGPCLNLSCRVSMDNLFTVADIDSRIEAMKKGNVTFQDLFKGTNLS